MAGPHIELIPRLLLLRASFLLRFFFKAWYHVVSDQVHAAYGGFDVAPSYSEQPEAMTKMQHHQHPGLYSIHVAFSWLLKAASCRVSACVVALPSVRLMRDAVFCGRCLQFPQIPRGGHTFNERGSIESTPSASTFFSVHLTIPTEAKRPHDRSAVEDLGTMLAPNRALDVSQVGLSCDLVQMTSHLR